MTAEFAGKADFPRLKEIWKRCFGDPDWYIDFYLEHGFGKFETMVLREQESIAAMLTLIPAELLLEGERLRTSYIYAVATDPEQQGKGYASALLEEAHRYLRKQGTVAAALFPASDRLYDYYGRLGYQGCFAVHETVLTPGENKGQCIESCGLERFVKERNAFLSRMKCSLCLTEPALGYVYDECVQTGGSVVWLKDKALQGYAVCTKIEETLLIKETNLSGQELSGFSGALAARFGAGSIRVKFPASANGTAQRHGMACVLDKAYEQQVYSQADSYMNLVLD